MGLTSGTKLTTAPFLRLTQGALVAGCCGKAKEYLRSRLTLAHRPLILSYIPTRSATRARWHQVFRLHGALGDREASVRAPAKHSGSSPGPIVFTRGPERAYMGRLFRQLGVIFGVLRAFIYLCPLWFGIAKFLCKKWLCKRLACCTCQKEQSGS